MSVNTKCPPKLKTVCYITFSYRPIVPLNAVCVKATFVSLDNVNSNCKMALAVTTFHR